MENGSSMNTADDQLISIASRAHVMTQRNFGKSFTPLLLVTLSSLRLLHLEAVLNFWSVRGEKVTLYSLMNDRSHRCVIWSDAAISAASEKNHKSPHVEAVNLSDFSCSVLYRSDQQAVGAEYSFSTTNIKDALYSLYLGKTTCDNAIFYGTMLWHTDLSGELTIALILPIGVEK